MSAVTENTDTYKCVITGFFSDVISNKMLLWIETVTIELNEQQKQCNIILGGAQAFIRGTRWVSASVSL